MPVWLRKTLLAPHNCAQQQCALAEKSVINMMLLLQPIIMIGPGGLLLVVLHLFAVPVSILWMGLQKSI
jgi:hypothetical protein